MATTEPARAVRLPSVRVVAVAVWSVLAVGLATDHVAVTAPAALVIAFLLPGWTLVGARSREPLVERFTVAVGLSFTVLLAIVVVAAALPSGSTRRAVVVGCAVVGAAGAWRSLPRRRVADVPGDPGPVRSSGDAPAGRRLPWWLVAVAGVATVLALGAAALVSVRSERSSFDRPVTQLGLVPVADQPGSYELSIINRDGGTTAYWFIVEMPGDRPARVDVELSAGEEYHAVLAPSAAGTLQVTLFGGPPGDRGYRQVRAEVN